LKNKRKSIMRKIALKTLLFSSALSAPLLAASTPPTSKAKAPAKTSKAKPKATSTKKVVTPVKAKSKTVKPTTKPATNPAVKPVATKTAPVKATVAAQATGPLYQNDLQKLEAGKLPDEFLVLGGDFSIVKDADNVLIELPAEPIDAFGLLYGPTFKNEGSTASARFFGTKKGRRAPAFGVGLYGISGYKVRLSPAAGKLEILKDEMIKADVPFEWKSESWTRLRIQARPGGNGQWKVQGRAWPDGEKEPETWQIEWTDSEAPPSGRASLIGAPYSGIPLRFDDLMADKVKP
jgi:hypothetical protein